MQKLQTNGLVMPDEFPADAYQKVSDAVAKRHSTHQLYLEYAGAWNALSYRYMGMVDSGERLATSFEEHGAHPESPLRYKQEQDLFEFFSSGFSVFESTFYGLYAIGGLCTPSVFPLGTAKEQQRVTPARTAELFKKAFPSDPINSVITAVLADPPYQRWRDIRNVLTHRTAPGRRIYVSIGSDEDLPVEWKLQDLPLTRSLISESRTDLARLLTDLIDGIDSFATMHLQ